MARPSTGLTRRTVLRGMALGAGVSLALPPLEAMLGPAAHAGDSALGPIFGIFFWANGTPWHAGHGSQQGGTGRPDLWTPPTEGADYTPSELLTPLARHKVDVITGLTPHTEIPTSPAGQSDGHMRGFMVSMTSDRIRPEGFDHPSHTLTALRPTLDQVIAKDPRFYADYPSRFRSLEIGVSRARFHDYGHWNAISYNGPDSLNAPVMDPGQLYDRLFGVPTDNAAQARRAALLDAVMGDAEDLRGKLGAADRNRLDEHLEHLYEVQRRLDLGAISCETPTRPGTSGDLHTQTRTMAELLALGLSCNLTRVFSFMLTSPATTHVFSNLGATAGLHKTCHDGIWQKVREITTHQMEAFALFLDVLDSHTDPTGATLLDRALVYGTSEYGEGWKHSVKEFPVLLAGGADGGLNRGIHVREADGNLSKAHVTLFRALGLETESYGFNGGQTSDAFGELLA